MLELLWLRFIFSQSSAELMAVAAQPYSREQNLQGFTPSIPLSSISTELSPVLCQSLCPNSLVKVTCSVTGRLVEPGMVLEMFLARKALLNGD